MGMPLSYNMFSCVWRSSQLSCCMLTTSYHQEKMRSGKKTTRSTLGPPCGLAETYITQTGSQSNLMCSRTRPPKKGSKQGLQRSRGLTKACTFGNIRDTTGGQIQPVLRKNILVLFSFVPAASILSNPTSTLAYTRGPANEIQGREDLRMDVGHGLGFPEKTLTNPLL